MGRTLFFLVALPACGAKRSAVPEAIGDSDSDSDSDADVDADSDSDTASEVDPCDADRDGSRSTDCGGDDCDDSDATIHPDAADGDWLDEVVDGTFIEATSLDIDGAGNLHVAWVEGGTLVYATNRSGDWVTQDLDDREDAWATIAVEADGTPHIAFGDVDGHGRLAVLRGGLWAIEHFADEVGWDQSIDLDPAGRSHLTYFDEASELVYMSNTDGIQSTEVVAGEYSSGATSLAIDSSGSAHIGVFAEDFSYLTNQSGEWVLEPVTAAGGGPLALDPDGGVHAALVGDGFMYASRTGPGEWTLEIVSHEAGDEPQLAIGEDGVAHIAYVTNSPDFGPDVRYLTNAAGEWGGRVIHAAFAFHPSIALDPDGVPHVVYVAFDDGVNQVRHAWPPPPDGIDQDCDGVDG